jgi:hypothetical protein
MCFSSTIAIPDCEPLQLCLRDWPVQQYWGRIFFNFVAFPSAPARDHAVRPGTIWKDNMITGPNGFGIAVYDARSSIYNVSLAVLCWLTVSMWQRQYQ